MRIYLLFHEQFYPHERIGGYIWAPEKQFSDIGKYNFENVKRLQKGDVVYSVVEDKVVSVNIITSNAEQKRKPNDLDIPAAGSGWSVSANYSQLKRPVLLQDTQKKEIARLSVEREIPYDENCKENEGRIFEIPYETHKYLMGLVSMYNFANKFDLPELQERDVELVHQTEHMLEEYEDTAHKKLALRMSMMQTVMKQRLMKQTKKCAICDIDYDEFLTAVYCKPWDEASTNERLDLNNMLLLCPLHRDMFEKGLISFNEKGMIKISSEMRFENFKSLSVNMFTSINITEGQTNYIGWHAENVFKK